MKADFHLIAEQLPTVRTQQGGAERRLVRFFMQLPKILGWILFIIGILIFGGAQIAGLGIRLMKK